jgi:hypothetical protein
MVHQEDAVTAREVLLILHMQGYHNRRGTRFSWLGGPHDVLLDKDYLRYIPLPPTVLPRRLSNPMLTRDIIIVNGFFKFLNMKKIHEGGKLWVHPWWLGGCNVETEYFHEC